MSLTLSSLFAMLLNWYVSANKIDLGVGDIQEWVQTTIAILAPIGIYWGRFRLGDINWFGLRDEK